MENSLDFLSPKEDQEAVKNLKTVLAEAKSDQVITDAFNQILKTSLNKTFKALVRKFFEAISRENQSYNKDQLAKSDLQVLFAIPQELQKYILNRFMC